MQMVTLQLQQTQTIRIDIAIAGADDFQLTANTFTILSGSTLNAASGGTVAIAAGGAITNAGTMSPDISSTGKTSSIGVLNNNKEVKKYGK